MSSKRFSGARAVAVQADIGKAEDIERLFAEADAAFGGQLDVLVNNAGVFELTPLDELKPEIFHRIFFINVLGTMLCSQAAARRMSKGGSIINVSSVVSVKGFRGVSFTVPVRVQSMRPRALLRMGARCRNWACTRVSRICSSRRVISAPSG